MNQRTLAVHCNKIIRANNYLISILLLASTVICTQAYEYADSPGAYPHGLTTDGVDLWHADYDNRTIYKIDNEGQIKNSFNFPHGKPRGLAYSNGILFVATGSLVFRMNASNMVMLSFFFSPDSSSPNHQGLAFGEGKLWIASRGDSDDRIYGVDPVSGQLFVDFESPGTNPRGLTYYKGSLWNLDSSADKLFRLSTNSGKVQASYPIPLGNPRGLTNWNDVFLQADSSLDLLANISITNTFSDVYLAPSTFAKESVGHSRTNNSLWLPYISNQPIDQSDETIRRILIFQSGIGDDAVNYFFRARHAAKLAGCLDETFIASLQLIDDGNLCSVPPAGMIYWTGSRHWGGLSAGTTAPYPRTERVSAFELLDDFLSNLTTDPNLFPNLQEIIISGHSGGGQFTNCYAITSPFENDPSLQDRRITLHYVVMNPSSYLYLNDKRYDPRTIDLSRTKIDFIIPLASNQDRYNDYGYGLENLYSYPASVGSTKILKQYPNRKVTYMIGESDIGLEYVDVSPAAMLQGSNRYERCLIYYSHLIDCFGFRSLPQHNLITVPDVGHSGFDMITSEEGLHHIFQELEDIPSKSSVEYMLDEKENT